MYLFIPFNGNFCHEIIILWRWATKSWEYSHWYIYPESYIVGYKCWLKFPADNNTILWSGGDHRPSWECALTGDIIRNLNCFETFV